MSGQDGKYDPNGEVVVVYTLYDSLEVAEATVEEMVKDGFAACANILAPSRSCYMWNGVYETQTEYPVLFKADGKRREALMAQLAKAHPYEVPAILSWDAAAMPSYAAWVCTMTERP